MGDFDGGGRRRWWLAATALAAVLLAVAGGVWLGHGWIGPGGTAAAATGVEPGVSGAPMTPPWPAATAGVAHLSGTVDDGQGWTLPNPGAAGPFSVADQGVPYGYRHDTDGAALAAVNAVVAGKYLAGTFGDPWSALGFLADPAYAAQGGNPDLEAFFTGPVIPQAVGATPTTAPTPPTATGTAVAGTAATGTGGGGRVVGVRITPAAAPDGAVQAVVLWQSFTGEYRTDGQRGFTVRIAPVSLLLVWAAGDWKVAQVGGPPAGMDTVVLGVVPEDFPVPAETWHR